MDYISGKSEWLRLHECMALSRREASLTPARVRRSRDLFGTVSVRFPHYMRQLARRLSRVKLAVICGTRSALRRQSCSNCERRCQRIHCVRKYNIRFNIHVHGKKTFIFPDRLSVVKASRAHGFVPSRGFPQTCTRTTLSRPFRHRFGPVQASSTICSSEPVICLA